MSHRALVTWLAAATAALWGLGHAADGRAAQVLLLGRDGHARVQHQSLPAWATAAPIRASAARARPKPRRVNIFSALARLHQQGAISATSYASHVASLRAALSALKHLSGTPAAELRAVLQNLRAMAAGESLTAPRLPALFLTLDRNRQWWTTGEVPGANQIVNFAGSEIDWEYYPGQGLELQELANFFKADWFYTHPGNGHYRDGSGLLSEMISLASRRAQGFSWEYFFDFDGGAPPWISAMSQGTALEALADAYRATGNRTYLSTAAKALPVLRASPPLGVAVRTRRGIRFVQYSFDPARSDEVINAFLQTLIGLRDFARASGNPTAWHLWGAGNAEAQHEVPSFDTGRWSLYQPGIDDTIGYHELVTGFLQRLCDAVHARAYCVTAAHFRAYLRHPPAGVAP